MLNKHSSLRVFSIAIVLAMILAPVGLAYSSAGAPEKGKPVSVNLARADAKSPAFVPGVVLVGLKAGVTVEENTGLKGSAPTFKTSSATLGMTLRSAKAQSIGRLFAQPGRGSAKLKGGASLSEVYRVRLAAGASVMAAVKSLGADASVAYAEPDYLAYAADGETPTETPEDTGTPTEAAPATGTETPTVMETQAAADTGTPTPPGTDTEIPADTGTPSPTGTNSEVPIPTATPTLVGTETLTPTATLEPSAAPTATTAPTAFFDDPLLGQQWGLSRIRIAEAWQQSAGASNVTIAVLDSGIDLSHPDLAGQIWTNPGEIAGNGLDEDSNNLVDDVHGWNFVSNNNNVSDTNGHGTLVAGVIAAAANNGQGIAGVCPNCRIMPVVVMNGAGVANYSDIASGVLYAARKGAKIINISLGGYANSTTLRDAIDIATNDYGVLVVAGSGNENATTLFYPAAYDNVLAVAGTDAGDLKAPFSNYGSWVDVSAPAVDIQTTALGGGWVQNSGTSLAAPFASGLAGLESGLHPLWGQSLLRSQMIHTTDSIDAFNSVYAGQLGSGRLNAGRTLAPHPLLALSGLTVDGQANGRAVLSDPANPPLVVQLNLPLRNDGLDAAGVTARLTTSDAFVTMDTASADYGNIAAAATVLNAAPFSFSVASSAGYNHPIPFTLAVTDAVGYSSSISFTVTTETGVLSEHGTLGTQIWTSDKTYLITANVSIPTGNTLMIQPGTLIQFGGNYALSVRGMLIADGTPDQPIRFNSSAGGTWDRLFFDDLAIDAQTDVDGNYLSGSILRYVTIEGSTAGVTCSGASPYLSHLILKSGGINCFPGSAPVWLLDSTVVGGVPIGGTAYVYRNIISGPLSISGLGSAQDNTITAGGLSLDSGTALRNQISGGGLAVGGSAGSVQHNTVAGGNLSVGDLFNVSDNTVAGSLTAGNGATVDHNTVSNGIQVGTSAQVTWNTVENAGGSGLTAGDDVTARYNRLIGDASGMVAGSGLIEHNLIANNAGVGLQVGAATVRYNTFTANKGIAIIVQAGTPVSIDHNNLQGNTGAYDLYANLASGATIPAENNWWGTTDLNLIADRIYDWSDDDLKATVLSDLVLGGSEQAAPGYVKNVTVSPDVLGIQTGVFQVEFNKPMDTTIAPTIEFHDSALGSWSLLPLPDGDSIICGGFRNVVFDMAADLDGSMWIGVYNGVYHYDGGVWQHYDAEFPADSNGCRPVYSIAIDPNGVKWFGTYDGVVRFDGNTWQTYTLPTDGLPPNYVTRNIFKDIAVAPDGKIWFVTGTELASFDGLSWHVYPSISTGLASAPQFGSLAIGPDGVVWIGASWGGLIRFDGTHWQIYTHSNSGLLGNEVHGLAVDRNNVKWVTTEQECRDPVTGLPPLCKLSFDGTNWVVYYVAPLRYVNAIGVDRNNTKWFIGDNYTDAAGGVISSFDDVHWKVYDFANTPFPTGTTVRSFAAQEDGTNWFGMDKGMGIAILHGATRHAVVENGHWLSPTIYLASYDITSLIPTGTYRLSVADATDSDGMRTARDETKTFQVDYAGAISDKTPPLRPVVSAIGDGSLTGLSASWTSSDTETSITQYRYAIGTTPAGRDVVDWTYTSSPSMTRTGLNLAFGIPYYVTVGARNAGGLWSQDGVSNAVVAGILPSPTPTATPTQTLTPTSTTAPTATRTPTSTPTRTRVPTVKTFQSLAAQDGWILETGENTNVGGSLNSTAGTFYLGDDTARRQYRAILSFSTGSALPDTAVITKVTLKLKKSTILGGGNPVAIFQGFMLDIKNGFFGTAALQAGDFQSAGKTYGPSTPAAVGGWYSFDLTAARGYINKLAASAGLTQIRVRFKLDDNNNAVANLLSLYSGNAGAANRPQLIIQYYVP